MTSRFFSLRACTMMAAVLVVTTVPAHARDRGAILHEQIPADPREDVALSISLDGDLPAAIDTPSGVVPAPDPQRAPDTPAPYSPSRATPDTMFHPERDTQAPESLPYDEPFSPSTAPFKRMSAYDQVDAAYMLSVHDPTQRPFLPGKPSVTPQPSEDLFYADMVVDVVPGANRRAHIPSVGPGARILRARAGVGTSDVGVSFFRDGADNWYVEGARMTRARLVMEVAIPRAALGGDFGDPSWSDFAAPQAPVVAAVPANVARAATQVTQRIGVNDSMRPRDIVAKMTAYFRAFQPSAEGPPPTRDVYLDLALSQKGVCRHRAFAFLVTALALGIPTRMVTNEAHAWVEVYDGRMFRRIDLGGAGRMQHDEASTNVPYDNPADPFSWPPGASRGQDLANQSRRGQVPIPPPSRPADDLPAMPSPSGSNGFGPNGASGPNGPNGPNGNGGGSSRNDSHGKNGANGTPDTRLPTDVTLDVLDLDPRRGGAFHVRGSLVSDGDPCPHTPVTISLLSGGSAIPIGAVATDDNGLYDAAITLAFGLAVGDYDVRAYTQGNTRCGAGISK